jgi:hypothetical protein
MFRNGKLLRAERYVRDSATLAWTAEEMRHALQAHGFVNLEFLSGYTRKPHVPADEVFTVIAQRPNPSRSYHVWTAALGSTIAADVYLWHTADIKTHALGVRLL